MEIKQNLKYCLSNLTCDSEKTHDHDGLKILIVGDEE